MKYYFALNYCPVAFDVPLLLFWFIFSSPLMILYISLLRRFLIQHEVPIYFTNIRKEAVSNLLLYLCDENFPPFMSI